jgi:glucose-6-phosphate-specific signal transduction histidine kinase
VAANGGFGLKMMAYRARLLGATFRIEPGPRAGTRVIVALPMTQAAPPVPAGEGSARTDLDQQ